MKTKLDAFLNNHYFPIHRLLFLLCSAMAGCTPFGTLPPSDVMDHEYGVRRQSAICSLSLDRYGVGETPRPGLVTGPRAGFETVFHPGAQPFACDRLLTTVRQGAFKFDVRDRVNLAGRRFQSAWLKITEFTPDGEIAIVPGQPWDTEFGVGDILEPGIRRECQFRIRRAELPWPPAAHGPAWPALPLESDVPGDEAKFTVPFGSTHPSFLVTRTVRRWLSGEPEFGFVIEPSDPAMASKSDSRCFGLFQVELHIYAET